jgi:hypothetical protein
LKRTAITVVLSVILTFAGTAIAYNLLAKDSRAAKYQDFSYNANQAAAGQQYGGCRGSGRGGCGGCGRATGPGQQGAQGSGLKAAEDLAYKYFSETYGEKDFTVKVQDFGCHQEAYIIKEGQPVKRLSISGGNVYEVG